MQRHTNSLNTRKVIVNKDAIFEVDQPRRVHKPPDEGKVQGNSIGFSYNKS